jgi:hypothetical protein
MKHQLEVKMTKRTLPLGRMTARRNGTGRRVRLWEQVGSDNPTVQRLQAAYLVGLATMDAVEDRHAANKADRRYTPDGVRDDLKKFALSEAVPKLYRARAEIRRARAEADELRKKISLPAPNPADLAGAMRRIQIRTYLQSLTPEKRSEYIDGLAEKMPTEIAMAIVELPAEFSGVAHSQYSLISDQLVESRCAEDLHTLRQIEQAIEAAESAVEGARLEVSAELGIFDQNKFNELVAPVEARTKETSFVNPAWLRKRTTDGIEKIVVVDLEKGVERPASEDDIATGVFAKDIQDYEAQKTAAKEMA